MAARCNAIPLLPEGIGSLNIDWESIRCLLLCPGGARQCPTPSELDHKKMNTKVFRLGWSKIPFSFFPFFRSPDRRIVLPGDARPAAPVRDGLVPRAAPRLPRPPGLDRCRRAAALHHPPDGGRPHPEPAEGAHLLQPDRPAHVRLVPADVRQTDAGRRRNVRLCRGINKRVGLCPGQQNWLFL